MKKPNVLLIMTDQHRFDCLGCYGNDLIETPTIDWMASEGTVFTNAYTPSPSCIPARACLMSGQDPWNTGVLGYYDMGVGFLHTLPGELAKAGYHTKGIGKMHFYPQRSLLGFHDTLLDESGRVEDKGFVSDYRRWFCEHRTGDYDIIDNGLNWNSWGARPYHAPEHLHPTTWTVNESVRYIKERDRSMPFFLKVSFERPHSPYDPPSYYFDMYQDEKLPEPYVGEWAKEHDVAANTMVTDAWRGRRREKEVQRARAGYYGSISHIDAQLSRIIMLLREEGILENTLIIFTSDHGDMLGDHHLWRKTYAYEGSSHIPFIIRLPKAMREEISPYVHEPVVLQDIMPTVLEATGVKVPETVDGRSVLSLLDRSETSWREYVHGEHVGSYVDEEEVQYLTDGKMKYIWFPRKGDERLFHIEEDKSEQVDLSKIKKYEEVLKLWRARMVTILSSRDVGLTEGEELICQKDKPYMVSPAYKERMERSGFHWME